MAQLDEATSSLKEQLEKKYQMKKDLLSMECSRELGRIRKKLRYVTIEVSDQVDQLTQPKRQVWTPDNIEHLIKEYNAGTTLTNIAKGLNRTVGSVNQMLTKLKEQKKVKVRIKK